MKVLLMPVQCVLSNSARKKGTHTLAASPLNLINRTSINIYEVKVYGILDTQT